MSLISDRVTRIDVRMLSSMTSLRSQVKTLSELWDRRINELKWFTGYRQRLSSYIVWDIQGFATSTMIKRGKSFYRCWTLEKVMYFASRHQGESVLPCMETSSDTDVLQIFIIIEDNRIHWSYRDLWSLFLMILWESVAYYRSSTLESSFDFSVV